MSEHDNNELRDIERQIAECRARLSALHLKRRQLKHPDSVTLSIDEAAAMLGINRATAYKGARNGQLPAIRVGKKYLIPVAAIHKMLGIGDEK